MIHPSATTPAPPGAPTENVRGAPLLLLDIGNTRLKWGLAGDAGLGESGAVVHDGDPTAALRALRLPQPSALWVAHVTGAAQEARLTETLRALYGCDPQYARAAAAWHGLRSAYREPERLGVDRWLAMIAAWGEAQAPACVVDAGTALTVDCIDAHGLHLGGIIAAGLRTQQRALLGHTRFTTRAAASAYDGGLGTDTEACVRQGALLACLGAVDRALALAGPAAPRRLLTGGDAEQLLPYLSGPWAYRPQLVLEGLLRLASDR